MVRFQNPQLIASMMNEQRRMIPVLSRIKSHIRRYLIDNHALFEVDMPVMVAGEDGEPRSMNLSSELQLKLYASVKDLANVFKFDPNQENCCQVYMMASDYSDAISLIEPMLLNMAEFLSSHHLIPPVGVDLASPFRKFEMIPELENVAGLNIPKDLDSEDAKNYLVAACARLELVCPPPVTTAKLLEQLVSKFLLVDCVNPTFIMKYPACMIQNPLAKTVDGSSLTEAFKLFANCREIAFGFTEVTDADIQNQHFDSQVSTYVDTEAWARAFSNFLTQQPPTKMVSFNLSVSELFNLFAPPPPPA